VPVGTELDHAPLASFPDVEFLQARPGRAHQHGKRQSLVGFQAEHAPAVDDVAHAQGVRIATASAEARAADQPVERTAQPPKGTIGEKVAVAAELLHDREQRLAGGTGLMLAAKLLGVERIARVPVAAGDRPFDPTRRQAVALLRLESYGDGLAE